MPKGHKTAKVLEKEAMRELLRAEVAKHMSPLVKAQVANALGLSYMVLRDRITGKFVRLDQDAVKKLVDDDDQSLERVEIWQKDPSVQAFTDLMNRTLDKPKEQEQEIKISGTIAIEERLHAARKRLADKK